MPHFVAFYLSPHCWKSHVAAQIRSTRYFLYRKHNFCVSFELSPYYNFNKSPKHIWTKRWTNTGYSSKICLLILYCKFGNFRKTWHMRSFLKIIPWKNDKTTLTFTDIGKSCPSPRFLTSQICHLTLFTKISKFTVMRPTYFVPLHVYKHWGPLN